MKPRQACLACLEREPVALLEAALWIAAEHDRSVEPAASLAKLHDLQREISTNLPMLPLCELAQPLLRQLNALGFQQDEYHPLRPHAAMMDKVLQRRRGQPLTLAILALELARRLSIPLEGVGFPGHFLLRVADNGTISVPYAGNVPVAGVGLQTVEERIVSKLTGRAFQPQVVVELAVDRSNTYAVSGDVKQPGRYSLLEGAKTLADAINRAGGTARAPNQHDVILKRRGVEYRIPMSDLLAGGDIMLQRDDTLVVTTSIKAFTALGAVLKSGNIEINRTKVSLLEALGEVGGLSDERANKTGVFVFRPQDSSAFAKPSDRPVVYRLDFAKPTSVFVAQQFAMHPRDVVYVSNSPLYEANKVLSVFGTLFNLGFSRAATP